MENTHFTTLLPNPALKMPPPHTHTHTPNFSHSVTIVLEAFYQWCLSKECKSKWRDRIVDIIMETAGQINNVLRYKSIYSGLKQENSKRV